jgi:CBS domain-containing protein
MQLKEVMTRRVEVICPDATLEEAAEKMKSLDVGPLPVCDGERLVGMITDRDITVRATSAGKEPKRTPVRDVMTEEIKYCFEDEDVQVAADLMAKAQIRRLVVLNRDKRLVGIVSLGDLATEPRADEEAGEALEEISEPAEPQRSGR